MEMQVETSPLLSLNLDLAPMRITEIVLKTTQFAVMKAFYQGMLGVAPFLEHNPQGSATADAGGMVLASQTRMCFIETHPEFPFAQVLGIFEVAKKDDTGETSSGLHHMQFRNASMDDLFTRYDRLKSVGILPHRTANNGPGTSFYYRDPDKNVVEISASNFAGYGEYLAFVSAPERANNPSGMVIDAEEYIARYRSGIPLNELVKLPG